MWSGIAVTDNKCIADGATEIPEIKYNRIFPFFSLIPVITASSIFEPASVFFFVASWLNN